MLWECVTDLLLVNGLGLVLLFVLRFILRKAGIRPANDALGASFSIIGTIFAVILGFMLIEVWTAFDDAQRNAQMEAESLVSILHVSEMLPDPVRHDYRKAAHDYALTMVQFEWPAMAQGTVSKEGVEATTRLWELMREVKPRDDSDKMYLDHLLGTLQDLVRLRKQREARAQGDIPLSMWLVLYVGTVITIAFSCLFEVDSLVFHVAKVVGLCTMIGIVLFAISEVGTPFSGTVHVSSQTYTDVAKHIEQYYPL